MIKDIRWDQRFKNFSAALAELSLDMDAVRERKLNRIEEKGLIKSFEFTYEMAWNTLKDYFENQGEVGITGSRSAIRQAFKRGLIENGQLWMDMVDDRIATVHTYNKETADDIAQKIIDSYYSEFLALHKKLTELKKELS